MPTTCCCVFDRVLPYMQTTNEQKFCCFDSGNDDHDALSGQILNIYTWRNFGSLYLIGNGFQMFWRFLFGLKKYFNLFFCNL